jgi:hypothetical protein
MILGKLKGICDLDAVDFEERPDGSYVSKTTGEPCTDWRSNEMDTVTVSPAPPRSDSFKKYLIFGGLVAAAGLFWWLQSKPRTNPSRKRRKKKALRGNPGKAVQQYQGFHWGKAPNKISRVKPAKRPKKLVGLGQLEAVIYRSDKNDGKHDYIHHFKGQKPLLAMDSDNTRLHLVGGSYTVEDRGIVG